MAPLLLLKLIVLNSYHYQFKVLKRLMNCHTAAFVLFFFLFRFYFLFIFINILVFCRHQISDEHFIQKGFLITISFRVSIFWLKQTYEILPTFWGNMDIALKLYSTLAFTTTVEGSLVYKPKDSRPNGAVLLVKVFYFKIIPTLR